MDQTSQDDIKAFGDITRETLDASDIVRYAHMAQPGINEEVVRQISSSAKEPQWMLEHRLKSLQAYQNFKKPSWGPSLESLDLESIYYFAQPE
jgi:Fe-S cluster assembly protein SufB